MEDFKLAQTAFKTLAAAVQRLVDGLGRRCETPLQDGERKAHGSGAPVVLQRVGAVELLAHVVGDFAVKLRLGVRQLVGNGVGHPLGEERGGIELQQLLLDHPAHQVGHVGGMDAIAEPPLEPIAVEERHEKLEVLLLAVVGRRGHQQEVPGQGRQQLAKAVALGVLDLAAEDGRRHLVGLVAHDKVPTAIRRLQLLLDILVARQLVEPGDDQIGFEEPITGAGSFQLVVGQNLERQVEAAIEFVLPLLGQAAGADNQAALQIAPGDQLLHQQPGHDGLARAGIVGQQEAQWLARQHGLVDGGDLVRQRLHHRGVNGENRVKEMGQPDTLGLGDEAEEVAVAIEAPRPADRHHLDSGFVVAVEQFVGDPAFRRLVGQFDGGGAVPLHVHHGHQSVGQNAANRGVGGQFFKLSHISRSPRGCGRPSPPPCCSIRRFADPADVARTGPCPAQGA